MDPNMLPIKQSRTFRSEAEYRLWQRKLATDYRRVERGEGLVSRIVNIVRKLASQKKNMPQNNTRRVSSRRPAKQQL